MLAFLFAQTYSIMLIVVASTSSTFFRQRFMFAFAFNVLLLWVHTNSPCPPHAMRFAASCHTAPLTHSTLLLLVVVARRLLFIILTFFFATFTSSENFALTVVHYVDLPSRFLGTHASSRSLCCAEPGPDRWVHDFLGARVQPRILDSPRLPRRCAPIQPTATLLMRVTQVSLLRRAKLEARRGALPAAAGEDAPSWVAIAIGLLPVFDAHVSVPALLCAMHFCWPQLLLSFSLRAVSSIDLLRSGADFVYEKTPNVTIAFSHISDFDDFTAALSGAFCRVAAFDLSFCRGPFGASVWATRKLWLAWPVSRVRCSAALQVVQGLNLLFSRFDELTDLHKVYKVETIGELPACYACSCE
jgi:hypothetical protein